MAKMQPLPDLSRFVITDPFAGKVVLSLVVCGNKIVESDPSGNCGPWDGETLQCLVAHTDGDTNTIYRLPAASDFRDLVGRQLVAVHDQPERPGLLLEFDNGRVLSFGYDYGAGDIRIEIA